MNSPAKRNRSGTVLNVGDGLMGFCRPASGAPQKEPPRVSGSLKDQGTDEDSRPGRPDTPSRDDRSSGGEDSRSGGGRAQLLYLGIVPGEPLLRGCGIRRLHEQAFVAKKLRQIRDVRRKISALQVRGPEPLSQHAFVMHKLQQIRDVRRKISALQVRGPEPLSREAFVTCKLGQIRDVKQRMLDLQQRGEGTSTGVTPQSLKIQDDDED